MRTAFQNVYQSRRVYNVYKTYNNSKKHIYTRIRRAWAPRCLPNLPVFMFLKTIVGFVGFVVKPCAATVSRKIVCRYSVDIVDKGVVYMPTKLSTKIGRFVDTLTRSVEASLIAMRAESVRISGLFPSEALKDGID